jgi:lipopolysaccharide biosynthesis regulator YciM
MPLAARLTSWACALAPDSADNLERAVALARRAVAAEPDNDRSAITLGAILYRVGDYGVSIERLRALSERDVDPKASKAYALYFLSMADFKKGSVADARKHLADAIATADAEIEANKDDPADWTRTLTLELLRSEATNLIGMD